MQEQNFEEKVNEFIEKLKNFNPERLNRKIFNPWAQWDLEDIGENAPIIRQNNLKKYLLNFKNATYALIAESPSTGARFSGVAMTSEKTIEQYGLDKKYGLEYSSKNQKKYKKGEITANKVWKEITKKDESKFVLWNAFAFNIVKDEKEKEEKKVAKKRWFETPDKKELEANYELLSDFLSLFPNIKIIALGSTAKSALNALGIEKFELVRHPSNDFKNEFPKQIAPYL